MVTKDHDLTTCDCSQCGTERRRIGWTKADYDRAVRADAEATRVTRTDADDEQLLHIVELMHEVRGQQAADDLRAELAGKSDAYRAARLDSLEPALQKERIANAERFDRADVRTAEFRLQAQRNDVTPEIFRKLVITEAKRLARQRRK